MEQALRTSAGLRIGPLLNPLAMVARLWSQRELAVRLARREIIGRYRSSWLGLAWAVLQPLTLLAIYTFVFAYVFESRWRLDEAGKSESKPLFAITMFCGMLVFNLFSEVVTRAPQLVADNPNYVKKVVFPLEVLVVAALLTALFTLLVGLLVWMVAWLVVQQAVPHWTILLLPVVLLPVTLLAMGLGWLLASLGVFVRDIGQFVGLAMQVLFFATPIFYPIDRLKEPFQTVLRINPLSHSVEDARRVLMYGQMPDWRAWGVTLAIAAVAALLGYAFFMKSKRAFSDVL